MTVPTTLPNHWNALLLLIGITLSTMRTQFIA